MVDGTQIDLVSEPDPVTGEFLKARIDRVQMLLDSVGATACRQSGFHQMHAS